MITTKNHLEMAFRNQSNCEVLIEINFPANFVTLNDIKDVLTVAESLNEKIYSEIVSRSIINTPAFDELSKQFINETDKFYGKSGPYPRSHFASLDSYLSHISRRASKGLPVVKTVSGSFIIEFLISASVLGVFSKLLEATILKDIERAWPNTKFSKKIQKLMVGARLIEDSETEELVNKVLQSIIKRKRITRVEKRGNKIIIILNESDWITIDEPRRKR